MDAEQLFQALRALWRGDGATGRAIREQPALMRLEFVIQVAVKRTGLGYPPDSAVAEACKSCIKEAAGELPTPGETDDLRGRDRALAARIVLGVEDKTESLTLRGRRDVLKDRLAMSEDQVAHKRSGNRFTFEESVIYDVAVILSEWEPEELGQQESPPESLDKEVGFTLPPSDFEVVGYRAQLTVDGTQVRPGSETAHTFRVFRSLLLRATKNGARHYCHVDERSNARRWKYSVVEGGRGAPRYVGLLDQWSWKVTHIFDYGKRRFSKDDLLMLAFGTVYLSPAYGNHMEYTADRPLEYCQLTLQLPPGLDEVKAFARGQSGKPEDYKTWIVARDNNGLFVLAQEPAVANCTYGLMYPTITA